MTEPEHDVEPMTADEVRRIFTSSCGRKHRFYKEHPARLRAESLTTRGRRWHAYRCVFSRWTGGPHWHVGRQPRPAMVERIALAIRWCTDNNGMPDPDE